MGTVRNSKKGGKATDSMLLKKKTQSGGAGGTEGLLHFIDYLRKGSFDGFFHPLKPDRVTATNWSESFGPGNKVNQPRGRTPRFQPTSKAEKKKTRKRNLLDGKREREAVSPWW